MPNFIASRSMDMPSSFQALAREPLYRQVSAHLAHQISSGTWQPGTALPNENDLARQLGVSPGTIRKALDKLEAERLVRRRQGRGTFVVDQTSAEMASRFDRLRQRDGRRIPMRASVLHHGSGDPTQMEQERLKIGANEPVARMVRLWSTQSRPLMIEELCLAADRLPDLQAAEMDDWTITTIAQRHGIHLVRAFEEIHVEMVSDAIAPLLQITPGTVLLRLERVIFSAGDDPIEWRSALCHMGDEYYLGEGR
jgi:GntR family transcriptional regulator